MRSALLMLGSLAVAACAGSPGVDTPADRPPARELTGSCDAAAAQVHIGKIASQSIASDILTDSGARTLRWGPPRSAWTMDYRQDRVNVRYDDAMIITKVTCG